MKIKRAQFLPSPEEARLLTELAIEQGYAAVDDEWKEEARTAVLAVARSREVFSANDVWASGLTSPANRRVLGGVLRSLAAEGLIQKLDQKETSRWGHGQGISRWRII